MELTRQEIDTVLVLSFAEPVSIEGDASLVFKEKIRGHLEKRRRHLVLDMEPVDFVDSSGLGALISTLKLLRAEGGDLKLSRVGEKVHSVLEITRLLRVFETYATTEEAIAAMAEVMPTECSEKA